MPNHSERKTGKMRQATERCLLTVAGLWGWGWLLLNSHPNQEVKRMHPEQILRELDVAFEAYPVSLYTELHHFKVADARLTVLRSPQHWVIVIEKIGYFSRLHGSVDCFQRSYTLYGNCLEQGWFVKSDTLWDDVSELPFDPETGTWLPTRNHFQYFWEGKWWDVYPTEQDYQEAGIDPHLLDEADQTDWQANPELLQPVEWMRYLCYHLNHPFLASEARLREVVREAVGDPHIESALQMVLQTREWEHPDFLSELPSQTEGFRLIAQIIATGDASLWERANRSRFNSHWRYWIEKERQRKNSF